MNKRYLILLISFMLFDCRNQPSLEELKERIEIYMEELDGSYAVAFKDIQTSEQLLINEQDIFHAASTMKTPVMIEVYKQVGEGKWSLSDSIDVKNNFTSIVDSSPYSLQIDDDSEPELYKLLGTKRTLGQLMYDMIIVSSNLATNLIIELVDAKNVTKTMRELGAKNILILRGVEDTKAYEQGLNNSTTAYDLMIIFEKMARGEIINQKASDDMITILLDQRFNEMIPAYLPDEVKVAHKTGSITGVRHDSGIVILPDGRRYILILLSKNMSNPDDATEHLARVSRMIYEYVISKESIKTQK